MFCRKVHLIQKVQNSGENTCCRASFLVDLRPTTLRKIRVQHRGFPVDFPTSFLVKHLEWLLLSCFTVFLFFFYSGSFFTLKTLLGETSSCNFAAFLKYTWEKRTLSTTPSNGKGAATVHAIKAVDFFQGLIQKQSLRCVLRKRY